MYNKMIIAALNQKNFTGNADNELLDKISKRLSNWSKESASNALSLRCSKMWLEDNLSQRDIGKEVNKSASYVSSMCQRVLRKVVLFVTEELKVDDYLACVGIRALKLDGRISNALCRAGILTVHDLCERIRIYGERVWYLPVRNISEASACKVINALKTTYPGIDLELYPLEKIIERDISVALCYPISAIIDRCDIVKTLNIHFIKTIEELWKTFSQYKSNQKLYSGLAVLPKEDLDYIERALEPFTSHPLAGEYLHKFLPVKPVDVVKKNEPLDIDIHGLEYALTRAILNVIATKNTGKLQESLSFLIDMADTGNTEICISSIQNCILTILSSVKSGLKDLSQEEMNTLYDDLISFGRIF